MGSGSGGRTAKRVKRVAAQAEAEAHLGAGACAAGLPPAEAAGGEAGARAISSALSLPLSPASLPPQPPRLLAPLHPAAPAAIEGDGVAAAAAAAASAVAPAAAPHPGQQVKVGCRMDGEEGGERQLQHKCEA